MLANYGPVQKNARGARPAAGSSTRSSTAASIATPPARSWSACPRPARRSLPLVGVDSNQPDPSRARQRRLLRQDRRQGGLSFGGPARRDGRACRSRSIWAAPRSSCWKSATRATGLAATRPTGPTPRSCWPTARPSGWTICRWWGSSVVRTRPIRRSRSPTADDRPPSC